MKYKGVIWTNHILERMKERNLSYDDVYWVFRKPDEIKESKAKNGYKFYRHYDNSRFALVARKNEKDEWVFVTCWSKNLDKPYKQRRTKKHISFWRNLWHMLTGK
ncbi:MAG: DUF4258 domain-containing protein [Patescibacteria group bacterium]|jgi:hypothetical protein